MNAYMPLMVSLLSVMVFLLIVGQFMMRFSYRARMKERFDYLIHFPFEGYLIRSAYGRNAIMVLILSALSLGANFMFPLFIKSGFAFVAGRDIMVAVMGALLAVMSVVLCLCDAYSMRRHLMVFIVYAILYMVTGIVVGFMFMDYRDSHGTLALAFGIVSFALAFLGALVVLNPKLSSWGHLKKVGEGESAIYVRPRPFLLPFSQWILLLSGYILAIIEVVGLFLLGMQG